MDGGPPGLSDRRACPHRTSLARWLTSWRRSRSESRPPAGCGGAAPSPADPALPSSLFMWVQPEITQKLYVALWAAFLASCFFPYRLVGLAVGKEAPGGSGMWGWGE